MHTYKKQARSFSFKINIIACVFSVLISVVADSPKGEAVTNQNYNKICDILSFIKYKNSKDISALKQCSDSLTLFGS